MSLDLGGPEKLAPLRSRAELSAHLRKAEKPRGSWRVGVEHEKVGLTADDHAVPYEGASGIRALLEGLSQTHGALSTGESGQQRLHAEDGKPIAVVAQMASVTLEPGGQLELSGAPFARLADARAEIDAHLAAVSQQSSPRGLTWLGAGYRPFGTRDDAPWMPKLRYAAMRSSLGPRGALALDMMLMSATVQANLDWSDEADLAAKVRAATSVSPVVSALFANSPLRNGRPSGLLDFRYQVWRETDPARCGLLESMVQPGWGYDSYVEWALDVPLLFVRREGHYLDGRGQTFRQWMETGEAAGLSEPPTLQNWTEHLTTLFPEVRVKTVLELRGADVVPQPLLMSLPAVWVGLLYDAGACAAAWELTQRWTFRERLDFQAAVAVDALAARGPGGVRAQDLAREVIGIARKGLAAWGAVSGLDERALLDPVAEIAASGRTLAQRVLEAWESSGGDPAKVRALWKMA